MRQFHDTVVRVTTSPIVMSPTSPTSVRRHTLGMVYCHVVSGMRVTIDSGAKVPYDKG
jgi:hypothetical protein